MSAKIASLPSRALVSVQGPDWRSFLQGLISQDVQGLADGELRYGALLTPQGRLLFDFLIWGLEDGCRLETDAASADALAGRLKLYRLRAKVQIEVTPTVSFALWDGQPSGSDWRPDPRAPGLGFRSISEHAASVDALAYDAHRLALGVPDLKSDAQETDYPIELNFDLMQAFDFRKGCFIGQETSSRMHRRGAVKNRLAPFRFYGRAPRFGADILVGDRRVGTVRGSAGEHFLALVRLDRIHGGPLTVDADPVTLSTPTWLENAFAPATEVPVAIR